MKALVIGATGATGKELVAQLLEDEAFTEVHIFVRRAYNCQNPKLYTHLKTKFTRNLTKNGRCHKDNK